MVIYSLWIQTLSEKVLKPPNYSKLYIPQTLRKKVLGSIGIDVVISINLGAYGEISMAKAVRRGLRSCHF